MNRLWVRLALLLIAVTVTGVLITAGVAAMTTASQVNELANRQRAIRSQELVDALSEHYAQNGWADVGTVFESFTPRRGDRSSQGGPRPPRRGFPPVYVIADPDYRVVYDSTRNRLNQPLNAAERQVSLPIVSGDRTVGYLISETLAEGMLLEAQQAFLSEIRRTLLVAALAASAIATLIAIVVSRVFTRPLNVLADAAHAFSRRNWRHRAAVSSTREFGDVARAFNGMAESLERAEVNRRNLTADIAHELRTPLSVVQGNLRAMLDGVYPLENAEIAKVYDETRLISRLVDDLRELALAEAGQLTLRPEPVALAGVLRAARESFEALADSRALRFTVDTVAEDLMVNADADRLQQVLRNLIGNAFRHTPEGGSVSVSAARRGNRVRLSVRDTGEGIAPEDQSRIFDRFYRVDKSRARSSGGSGLGLPISKALIEAMGGAIGVISAPGQGSEFWVELTL